MADYFKVNFIKHLLAISEKFIDDDRLSPLHISLYYALFQTWNLSKFRNPISINRSEMMWASKIGSANTYTKCLKELSAWSYINYKPSFNPHKGSQVYMYNFNNTTNNASDISTNKTNSKASAQATDKTAVIAMIPSINNTNKLNSKKSVNTKAHSNNNQSNLISHEKSKIKKKNSTTVKAKIPPKNKKEKLRKKKKDAPSSGERRNTVPRPARPLLEEVQAYFQQKAWPPTEAEKYFNHYQSNGWLVGGKTPMVDWQASCEKWMLNLNNFQIKKASKFSTSNQKNYAEPL
jgi:hypothetical protein